MRRLTILLGALGCVCMQGNLQALPAVAEFKTLPTPAPVTVFLIANSGRLGAGVCRDGRLRVWALPEGRLLRTVELGSTNFDVTAMSHDGRWFLTGTHTGEVVVWDTGTGKAAFQNRLLPYPSAAAFSRDNQYLAVAASGGPVQVFELSGNTKRFDLEPVVGGTVAVVFSPDGALMATADADTQVRVHNSRTGKLVACNRDFLLEPFTVDFSADGKQVVAAGGDKVVVFLDAASGNVVRRLRKLAEPALYVEVSGDGKWLATLMLNEASFSQPAPVTLWETGSGRKRGEWRPPSMIVGGGWTLDGYFLAATTTAEAVHIWRVY